MQSGDDLLLERRSDTRRKLRRLSSDAASSARMIRRADSSLKALEDIPPLREFSDLGKEASQFEALSSMSGWLAETLFADKGGPTGMVAFRMLVSGLARAFENATGRAAKATWNQYRDRYEGDFVGLVESVFTTVLVLAPEMPHPGSALARGKYIYDSTRLGAKATRSGRGERKRPGRRTRKKG